MVQLDVGSWNLVTSKCHCLSFAGNLNVGVVFDLSEDTWMMGAKQPKVGFVCFTSISGEISTMTMFAQRSRVSDSPALRIGHYAVPWLRDDIRQGCSPLRRVNCLFLWSFDFWDRWHWMSRKSTFGGMNAVSSIRGRHVLLDWQLVILINSGAVGTLPDRYSLFHGYNSRLDGSSIA